MKVIDLLSVVSEHANVLLFDHETENMLAFYNGKDAIEAEYNGMEVLEIRSGVKNLIVIV